MSSSRNPHRHSIFVSYAREDLKFLEELRPYLLGVGRALQCQVHWDDTEIRAGDVWRAKIDRMLDQARVAVVLASQHSIASDFIQKEELPYFRKRMEAGEVTIVPLLVGNVPLLHTGVADLQLANPGRPLRGLAVPKREGIYKSLSDQIERRLKELSAADGDAGMEAAPLADDAGATDGTTDIADLEADGRLPVDGEWACSVPEAMALDQIEEALQRLKRLTRQAGFVVCSYDRFYVQFFFSFRTDKPDIEIEVASNESLSPEGVPVLNVIAVRLLKKRGFEKFEADGNFLKSAPFGGPKDFKALAKLAWEVLTEYFPSRPGAALEIESKCR